MVDLYNNTMVARQALQTPTANAAQFGGGIGQAMQGAGQAVQSLGSKTFEEKEKDDVNAVMELETELDKFNIETDKDLYSRRGKQALGVGEEYKERSKKFYDEMTAKLTNGRQKQLFENMYNRKSLARLESLSRFEIQEKQRYYDETTAIRMKTAIDDALSNYSDDKIVNQAFNSGLAAIKVNYAGRDELMADKIKGYKSEFYKLGVLRRAEDNAALAQEYYNQHKKEIAGSELMALEKQLKQNTTNQFALNKADELWKSGKSESEQLAEAYKINDPDKRDATIARIHARAADDRRAVEEEHRNKLNASYNEFNKAETAEEAQSIIDKTIDFSAKKLLRQEYEIKFGGKKRETDWNSYYELKQLAADDPDHYKKVNLLQYRNGLNDTEFKELVKLQTATGRDEAFKIRTRKQIIDQSLKPLKVSDENKALFFRKAEEMAMLEKAETAQSFQNIVDRLLVKGEVLSGAWYKNDPDKRAYELDETEYAKWQPDVIPPAEEAKILEALKRAGKPITKSEIKKLYKLKTLGGKYE